jgi:Clathrin adaptor complex small chain
MCNFLEYKGTGDSRQPELLSHTASKLAPSAKNLLLMASSCLADTKVVYRRYASLFFIAGCSSTDNELITLEIVHRYVEQMDKYYGNVCELDIIFNFQKAYFILDELLLAGEMQESSKKNVLRCISQQDSLEDMEVGLAIRHFPQSHSRSGELHGHWPKLTFISAVLPANHEPLVIRSMNILYQRSCDERYL